MMQTFSVPLSSFPKTEAALIKQLDEILSSSHLADISNALVHENKDKFGPSAISNLNYDVVDYSPTAKSGRLRFWYDMQLTFGCEDLVKDHKKQHSSITSVLIAPTLKFCFAAMSRKAEALPTNFNRLIITP